MLTRRKFISGLALTSSTQIIHAQNFNKKSWQKQREKTLAGMQEVMGKLPKFQRTQNRFWVESFPHSSQIKRWKIKYESDSGDLVPAYLLFPEYWHRGTPAMLCLHQTTKIGKDEPAGLGGKPELHYAEELAMRGYVCIVPDYPYLGENKFNPYEHGYESCTMKGIVNHMRAIDILQAITIVNPKRIGVIGHSLGGHNSLFVAAFDQRIKAAVTSCGFTKFSKYNNGNLKGWAGERYMPLIEKNYHNDPAQMPFDFPDILSAIAPRPVFVNAPLRDSNFDNSGVRDCIESATPVYEKIFGAKEKLVAKYPDVGHEFPFTIRIQAYEFLRQYLK